MIVVRDKLFLRNLPARAFDSRAQGFSFPLTRRRSSCPPLRIWCVPTRKSATRLSATVFPGYRVPPPPEEHRIGARKRRAPGNTILNQTIAPPRLNPSAESRRQPVDCISRGIEVCNKKFDRFFYRTITTQG